MKDRKPLKVAPYDPLSLNFTSKINFNNHEKEVLLELISEYRDVIETKRNDAPIIEMKRNCWVLITQKFNSNRTVSSRTTTQLRALWKNLKAKAKRDVWRIRSEVSSNNNQVCDNKVLSIPTLSRRVCDILSQPLEQGDDETVVDYSQSTASCSDTAEEQQAAGDSGGDGGKMELVNEELTSPQQCDALNVSISKHTFNYWNE